MCVILYILTLQIKRRGLNYAILHKSGLLSGSRPPFVTRVLGFKHESKHNRSTVYLGVLDKLMEGSRSVICPCRWRISRSASSPPPCPRGWPAPAASATSSSRAPVCVFLMSCDPRCDVDIISSCINLNVWSNRQWDVWRAILVYFTERMKRERERGGVGGGRRHFIWFCAILLTRGFDQLSPQ